MKFEKYAVLLGSLMLAGCGSSTKSAKTAGFFAPDQYERLAEKISYGHKYLQNKKVAVLPFSYTDKHASNDGVVISERLLTCIINKRDLEVIERGLLEKVLSELNLQRSGVIDASSIKGLGKILGVEALVAGTLTKRSDGRIEINARLIKTETAAVIAAAAEVIVPDWEAATAPMAAVRPVLTPAQVPRPQAAFSSPLVPLTSRERAKCPSGMVYYWNFDNASQTSTRDVFGGYEAFLRGPVLNGEGKVNSALDFRNGDYFQVNGRAEAEISRAVTVEAWVKYRAINYSESGARLFCDSSSYCFLLGGAGSWQANMVVFLRGVSANWEHKGKTALSPDTWYHVAFTYDGSRVVFYLDGRVDGSFEAKGPINKGTAETLIGWDNKAVSGYHLPYNGLIDEVAVYNRALSSKEISDHYNKVINGKGYCAG